MGTVKTTTKTWTEIINDRDEAKVKLDIAIKGLKHAQNYFRAKGLVNHDVDNALAEIEKLGKA